MQSKIVITSVLFCFCLISCDLFETRTPEEPSQPSSNYVPPTDASLVLQNMVYAFQDGNAENYSNSFINSSFEFEASANAITKYGGIFQSSSWTKQSEKDYFIKTVNSLRQNSKVILEFSSYIPSVYTDSSEIKVPYRLDVPHTVDGVARNFIGEAQFTLIRDQQSGYWYIRRWVDIGSDSTWSDLKGAFAL